MRIRCILVCGVLILFANAAHAARYQRTKDGKTLVWNSQRGVAQDATWSGLRDVKGYATGEGTLIWYRLNEVVNSYTGKMVEGKFEGIVVKDQSGTRLQAKFVNGEKVGDWSEPGSAESRTPTPAPTSTVTPKPKEQSPTPIATAPPEESEILPTPIPFRSSTPRSTSTATPIPTPLVTPTFPPTPTATAIPTSSPTPTPRPTPVATPTASPTPTPTATPRSTSTPLVPPTATPPVLKSLAASPTPTPADKTLRLEETVERPARDSLALPSPAPSLRNALEEKPAVEAPVSAAPPPITGSKTEMVAQFKKQTDSVLAQVRDATGKFGAVERIDSLSEFPAPVSASVEALADQARDFRSKVGYEVAMYECGAETATVDALVAVEEATRDLAQKNAPAGRLRLVNFFKRYPAAPHDNQKALWRYTASMLMACNKVKRDAENHLERAKAFEAAGKKADALGEYKEIYRLYPNAITADKIKLLEEPPR